VEAYFNVSLGAVRRSFVTGVEAGGSQRPTRLFYSPQIRRFWRPAIPRRSPPTKSRAGGKNLLERLRRNEAAAANERHVRFLLEGAVVPPSCFVAATPLIAAKYGVPVSPPPSADSTI